ncbi:ABC transporter substrate-binding protein [Nocardioides sp.]|uniref:ABC transporter substrate-binding protein n=1 Tax=Nocardioides sp. TaxID=35761 RepID=UPI0026361A8E|nr:ABC transporter substrate-binding protein [Nocardioides sp.]
MSSRTTTSASHPTPATTVRRVAALATAAILVGSTLAACGSSSDSAGSSSATAGASGGASATAASAGSLAGVCPATVVLQADWEPEAEHAAFYALLGKDYDIDTTNMRTTGELMDGDTDTGVKVQIRIGGASVGYQDPTALMYADDDILLGFGRIGDTIATDAKTPVVGVMASMAKSPYAIYWDPATYPNVKTIADLKSAGATVLTQGEGQSATWAAYFAGSGILDAKQYDDSADNKPATFIAAGGKDAEVGFITAEPYMYEKLVKAWGKPVVGQTMGDAGYPEYFQAIVARKDDVTARKDCLAKLIPVMQRALAGYITDPAATNATIVKIVETYDDSWQYDAGSATYAHDTAVKLGILGPSSDGVLGKFESANVQKLIDIARTYRSDVTVPADLTPDSLVTNQFLDPSIK